MSYYFCHYTWRIGRATVDPMAETVNWVRCRGDGVADKDILLPQPTPHGTGNCLFRITTVRGRAETDYLY
jgi:hypothetical protein